MSRPVSEIFSPEIRKQIEGKNATLKVFEGQYNDARTKMDSIRAERDKLYQEYLRPLVGKCFKRGNTYAIISGVPQRMFTKTHTSLNIHQMPVLVFLYNPDCYLDVTLENGPFSGEGLMWPDTIFRGELPEEYNTDNSYNSLDSREWVEITQEEWVAAYQARCLEVVKKMTGNTPK